jgi:triphosphoribosyl-dephospho-CoA synthase
MTAAAHYAIRSGRPVQGRERGLVCELIADQAVLALLDELAAWPKPGLVSYVDSGSHTDMNAAMMQVSAEALRPFFAELARAGQDKANMVRLRTIGLRAEATMLAVTGGVNTHRGAIFGLGLLCAAAGAVAEISGAAEAAAAFLSRGGVGTQDWRARAAAVHAAFIARRVSPGGCADLLAMSLFVTALEGECGRR